ncbi:hypothetical protein HPB50_029266 [Hyalomma asiaticum]|nr:hypothetical protein HPB50_029266 [Hyalomma asiaticum]
MNVTIGIEVIISAGAINSPKLLMLSGVGPAEDLKKSNITPVAELPVGEGLMDHVIFLGLVITTNMDVIGLSNINQSMMQYLYNQTGLLTIPGSLEALLFTSSSNVSLKEEMETDHPDIELELTDLFPSPSIAQSPYVSNQTYEEYYRPMFNHTGFMNTIAMVQPKSRGTVKLNSTYPGGPPLIDLQFLSNKEDVDRVVNASVDDYRYANQSEPANRFRLNNEQQRPRSLSHAAVPYSTPDGYRIQRLRQPRQIPRAG